MNKLNIYDDKLFPLISDLLDDLNETEKRAIEEIVTKEPTEKWSDVAQRLNITDRQLRNIRNDTTVQEACYRVSKALFKSDLPDVYKTLTKKAKEGQSWAVRLFLEVSGELNEEKTDERRQNPAYITELARETLELSLKSDEELMKELTERVKMPVQW
jgi:hypothetical protein